MSSWNPTSPRGPTSLPDPLDLSPLRDNTSRTLHTGGPRIEPLPTPSACSPLPPTPLKGASTTGILGPMSPPTPAPSPSPRGRDWRYRDELEPIEGSALVDETGHMVGGDRRGSTLDMDHWRDGNSKGKGRAEPDRFALLADFKALPPKDRLMFLSSLARELQLPEALLISRKIEPRLKRDFLRELPTELALNCLSYVDDPKTLARASQVSRYWYTLFQDEQTWKDMCDRHRFGQNTLSTPSRPRSTVSASASSPSRGATTSEPTVSTIGASTTNAPSSTFTFTSPRSAAGTSASTTAPRNTDVRLPTRFPSRPPPLTESAISAAQKASTGPARLDEGGRETGDMRIERVPSARDETTSFRQRFKTAYLTESNWLRGGRVLASHTSGHDGVVTSLAIDNNFLTIGMANSQIHVFDATTGAFMKTLTGHTGGVWTLVMVSGCVGSEAAPPLPQSTFTSPFAGMGGSSSAGNSRRNSGGRPAAGRGRYGVPGRRASASAASGGGSGMTTRSSAAASAGYNYNSNAYTSPPGSNRPRTVLSFMGQQEISDPGPRMKTRRRGSDDSRAGDDEGDEGESEGEEVETGPQSDVCNAAQGFGNERAVVISGGCDRMVKVWDVQTGETIHTLEGHTSTVRCIKVLDGRPIAVTGSRDYTLRVWDINKGELLRTLEGHEQSVRCIEVSGNRVVSGSYDFTCKLWDVDTGECLHTLRGHYHQIYAVAFDGERVVTGSLDSTVRVWDAKTGICQSLLQGHTSLVGQLQLQQNLLVTGGSDGRVIVFDLSTNTCLHRLCAHDNSVTCIQFDKRFIISGGNDGRVKLWDIRTGAFVRELSRPGEAVWRVAMRDDKCVVLCQREGKTILELLSFKPGRGY